MNRVSTATESRRAVTVERAEPTAATRLSGQMRRARTALEAGRHGEALDALRGTPLDAFRLEDVSSLETIRALATEVTEQAPDAYDRARANEIRRAAQSYRCRSWRTTKAIGPI